MYEPIIPSQMLTKAIVLIGYTSLLLLCVCVGLESRKIPCVLFRVGAKPCLSPTPLEELKQLSYTDCGKELARCLDEVSVVLL